MATHRKGPAEHRYCVVQIRMYGDEKFKRLSKPKPNAQTLWCYLLHGPRTTRVPGVLIGGRGTMACDDLKWPIRDFDRCFAELEKEEMAVADWEAGLVYLPNAFRQPENQPASPPTAVAWKTELNSAPECALLGRIISDLRSMLSKMGPSFLASFDAGKRADSGQMGELTRELPTPLATTPSTPAEREQPREQGGEQPSRYPSPAPALAPSPAGGDARSPARSAAPVSAQDPQAAPLAWKALLQEAGDRLNAGRPFPTASGLPPAQEQEWLLAWRTAREVYTLDDLRKLGRALKTGAIWRMSGPITAGQLIKKLVDLLAEANAWDGTAPAPSPGRPVSGQPSQQEVADISARRRQEAIEQEERRARKRQEAEERQASPEEAAHHAREALAALEGSGEA